MSAIPHPRRQDGFALFVVLIALLILSMVAITYLATIRMRVRDQSSTPSQEYVQLAVDSVKNDLIGILNNDYPAKGAAGSPEAFDYPWTKASATLMPYTLANAAAGYPTAGTTLGDPACDDAWLASSCPDAATGKWPHVSNLKGAFLKVTDCDLSKKSGYPAGGPYVPTDAPSNNLESAGLVARVLAPSAGGDNRLVDTDGDGIGDALWFYPTVNHISNRRYAAAVYVEDLSAKLNVNTSLPLRDQTGAYPANDLLGLTASDVDLYALKQLFGATPQQLSSLVQLRSGGRLSLTSPASVSGGALASPSDYMTRPLDHVARMNFWAKYAAHSASDGTPLANDDATLNVGPALFGTRFGIEDETELRYGGGLDRLTATAAVEKILDLRSVSNANTGKQEQNYTDAAATVAQFFRNNPRRWLTGFSGECLEQKGIDGDFGGIGTTRADINMTSDQDTYKKLFANAAEARPAYAWLIGKNGVAGDADDYPFSLGFQQRVPTLSSQASAFADVMDSILVPMRQCYWGGIGKSNQIAPHNASYGMVAVPELTEVYLQCAKAYNAGVLPNSGGTFALGSYGAGQEWGYCIEFSNPFACPVKLNGIKWDVRVSDLTYLPAAGDLTTDLTSAAWPYKDEDGDFVLLPGHKLLLYRDGTKGPSTSLGSVAAANIAMVGTKVAAAVAAGGTDIYGLNKVTKVQSSKTIASKTGSTPQFVEVQMWPPVRWGAGDGGIGYHYLTLPMIFDWTSTTDASQNTAVTEQAPAGWAAPANGTTVGIVQCSARTWGLSAGLDVLQCRPARQNKMKVDRLTTGAVSLQAGAQPYDQGDCQITYKRAFDTYDATLLDTLGKDDKGVPNAPATVAARASIKSDTIFFPGNNWYWDASAGCARYRLPARFGSLADLMRIVWLDTRRRNDGTNRGPALNNTNEYSAAYYTDTDLAHSLHQYLHDQSQETAPGTFKMWADVQALKDAGYSPLDILRFHPWKAAGVGAKAVDAAIPARNVPFGWYSELCWSDGNPGFSNAVTWDASSPQKLVSPVWVDGNGDGQGKDTNGNGLKDWGERDANENMALGRLNINTAPQWLLEEALPIKDAAVRKEVAKIIADRRSGSSSYGFASPLSGTRAANDLGIAYLCEILPAIQAAAKANNGAGGWDLNNDGVVDAKDTSLDAILAAVGPLFQTCSTRSDYFCAHILVQGYDDTDFTTGVKESARVMVIFKRTSAGVTQLGSFRY